MKSRWLDAALEPNAGLDTLPSLMTLGVVDSPEPQLLVANPLPTEDGIYYLRAFRGAATAAGQVSLPAAPSTLLAFNIEEDSAAALAVLAGPHVYVYKHMKPYYKWPLPNILPGPSDAERSIWAQSSDVKILAETLERFSVVAGLSTLAPASQWVILAAKNNDFEMAQKIFANIRETGNRLEKPDIAVCGTVLSKAFEPRGIEQNQQVASVLVIGAQSGCIHLLDPVTFNLLETFTTPEPPLHIGAIGAYQVSYRLACVTRRGYLCLAKRSGGGGGSTSVNVDSRTPIKAVIRLDAEAVAMEMLAEKQLILLALMDHTLHCYSKRGSKLWQVPLSSAPLAMCLIPIAPLNICLTAVSMASGLVCLWDGRHIVDEIIIPGGAGALRFGRLGLEEHALVLVGATTGTLHVKILRRTAHFTPEPTTNSSSSGAGPLTGGKLHVPRVHLAAQAQRERDDEVARMMHLTFQKSLMRFRITAAEACLKATQLGTSGPHGGDFPAESLGISASILGIGPFLLLKVTVRKMAEDPTNSATPSSGSLLVCLSCDSQMYRIARPVNRLPALVVVGRPYSIESRVEVISETSMGGVIEVAVVNPGRARPLVAAKVLVEPPDLV